MAGSARRRIALALGLAVLLAPASGSAQTAHDLMQQALVKEQAEGDLRSAIELYGRIAEQYPSERPLAARALMQMGRCYERLGSRQAQDAHRRVLETYADQREPAAGARSRLAVLDRSSPEEDPRIHVRRLLAGGQADPGSVLRGGPHPDGRHFAWIDWDTGDLKLRDLVTGDSRRIVAGDYERGTITGAKVSPDGELVAYYWYPVGKPADHGSGTMLRLVATDGSNDRLLQYVGGIDAGSWSWDSRHLAAVMHNLENTRTERQE